jgi:hypothetical protein
VATTPGGPVAKALLSHMQANGPRLRALLAEEAEGAADLTPAGEAGIRAHLRFVAETLAALATPNHATRLEGFAENLPRLLDAHAGERAEAEARARDALAFEATLQLGDDAPDDPSLQAMLARRARLMTAMHLFLRLLDEALAPDGGMGSGALEWMGQNQSMLSVLNARTGLRQQEARGARAQGPDVQILAQASMVQAHVRFLVEAIGAGMTDAGARPA